MSHDWQAATCISPESCSRCNVKQGVKGGHTLADATDGKTKPCTVCGEKIEIQYVALTFDDGPSGKVTKKLLDGLKERDVHATFFLCGYRIKLFPDYPQLIADYGNEVGLHTENHAYLTNISYSEIREEITKELSRIPDTVPVRLMRPPGGLVDGNVKSICSNYGLAIIMWSLDTQDWDNEEPEPIIEAFKTAEAGDIILMHDIKENSVNAALDAIDMMKGKGFEFVTVSELSEIMGTPLYGGSVYHSM